jgi:hypothetical protein
VSGEVDNFDLSETNFPRVAIIILNWNSWKDDREFYER